MEEILKQILDNLKSLNSKVDKIDNSQTKMEMKIEQNFEPKIKALFDHKDIVDEKLEKIENKLEVIEKKVDDLSMKVTKQEVEIKVIQGGKSKKAK